MLQISVNNVNEQRYSIDSHSQTELRIVETGEMVPTKYNCFHSFMLL